MAVALLRSHLSMLSRDSLIELLITCRQGEEKCVIDRHNNLWFYRNDPELDGDRYSLDIMDLYPETGEWGPREFKEIHIPALQSLRGTLREILRLLESKQGGYRIRFNSSLNIYVAPSRDDEVRRMYFLSFNESRVKRVEPIHHPIIIEWIRRLTNKFNQEIEEMAAKEGKKVPPLPDYKLVIGRMIDDPYHINVVKFEK